MNHRLLLQWVVVLTCVLSACAHRPQDPPVTVPVNIRSPEPLEIDEVVSVRLVGVTNRHWEITRAELCEQTPCLTRLALEGRYSVIHHGYRSALKMGVRHLSPDGAYYIDFTNREWIRYGLWIADAALLLAGGLTLWQGVEQDNGGMKAAGAIMLTIPLAIGSWVPSLISDTAILVEDHGQ